MRDFKDDLAKLSFAELADRLEHHSGKEVTAHRRRIRVSFYIFFRNYRELIELLDVLTKPETIELRAVKHREKHEIAMREVARRLHNFLCAAESLGYHARRIMQIMYSGTSFEKKYLERTQKTFHTPFANFVQDMRDFAVHCAVPPFSDIIHFKLDNGKVVNQHLGIRLTRSSLLKWKGWKAPSKKYLQGLDTDEIDLLEVVSRYTSTVRSFYRWLDQEQRRIHKNELEEFRRLQNEFHRRLREQRGDAYTTG